uniref:NADH-ubiquinone oxidoreductase chain 4 n=1 Tax=Siboglinum fiordicum TaxID=27908 RepID=A0A0E3DRC7_9ANNE|nr:NADH dehydrogenase subunit 4 [Siboglinum fiordicum]AIL54870.1 NADH dehydrogenase subunit 4 [Siboglinum fiordicum]
MLKLIIPIFSFFFLNMFMSKNNFWFIIMNLLFFFTPLFIIFFFPLNNLIISFNKYFSIDIISSFLIILSLWITALMIMSSFSLLNLTSYKSFINITLFLFILLFLTFSTNNMFLFYIFFESSLIPIFSMIMIWGYQPERIFASLYLLMYTITASLPLLIMIFLLFNNNSFMNMFFFCWKFPSEKFNLLLWMMSLMAFLIKLPMFSLHLWLPKAHVEAPVAGSMILASVLLKLGSYGIIRFSSLFFYLNKSIFFILFPICLLGSNIISIMCIRQTDMKSLIAYSSVSHMSILLMGMISLSSWGWSGSFMLMLSHGFTSSSLFLITNIMYSSSFTRSIFLLKGISSIFPMISLWWFILNALNMSAPPSLNLMSEIMLFSSIIPFSLLLSIPLAMLSFFTALYSFFIYISSQHGNFYKPMNFFMSIPSISFLSIFLHFTPLFILIFKINLFLI